MSPLDATFGALADPTRRGVIDLLRRAPRRASDLADELGASRPAMSRHLRVLRRCGIVEASGEDDARVRLYRLRPERFGELRAWLDEVDAFWTDQLAAFAAHVTRKRT
jgi:DNA-binding transcriptional ArsR family regulator